MNTVRILFCSLLFLAFLPASSQDKPKTNDLEFGVVAFNLDFISAPSHPSLLKSTPESTYGIVTGLFIKKHFQNKSYRIMFNQRALNVDYKAYGIDSRDSLNTVGEYSRTTISIGGEKVFFNRKMFQLYWGMDLTLLIGKYTGITKSTHSAFSYNSYVSENGAGLASFIGARFTMMERLRISVEPKLSGILYQQKETRKDISSAVKLDSKSSFAFNNAPQVHIMVSYLF